MKNIILAGATFIVLVLATTLAVAAPSVSPQILAEIEQVRFVEMPFEAVKAQVIEKLVRAGYNRDSATQLAQEILSFENNGLEVSRIIENFNAKTAEPVPVESKKRIDQFSVSEMIIIIGADWALNEVHGRTQDTEFVKKFIALNLIMPYRRTLNGVRTEAQVFNIIANKEKILLLYPVNGRLQLIFGAPVSNEMREAAGRNSVYLLQPGEGNKEFTQLLHKIVKADIETNKKFGKKVLLNEQDPFNREVQIFANNIVATNLELNTALSNEELAYFIIQLGQNSCEEVLK